ncbi:MAG TPA: SUF system NifU family Fe-S cluster assembly protein [Candidatus Nanoarchaeia archaeon]|nr:SUF system NifU family Fe-S cluster assembly protein [Candidatus Nanoarchaeia archaeon]
MDNAAMYRENILEHYQHPNNKGRLIGATCEHRAHNPLCGDDITIQLKIKGGKVEDVKFNGIGCAINTAAASLLTDSVKGKKVSEIMKLKKEDVISLLQIDISPVRLKCALLPLEALQAAAQKAASDKKART